MCLQVKFLNPVSTVEHSKINEWLTMVEKEMRVTLAACLAQAVKDIKQFKDGAIDPVAYIQWCDKYQVFSLAINLPLSVVCNKYTTTCLPSNVI